MILLDHPRPPAAEVSYKGFGLKIRSLSYLSVRTEVPRAHFPASVTRAMWHVRSPAHVDDATVWVKLLFHKQ